MILAPIALFVYNRPRHTRQTVEALQENELAGESELFIFSDGPKNDTVRGQVKEVRDYIKTIEGFKKITIKEQSENLGLAKSIISGVTDVINKYGRVIVMEDDLLSHPQLLEFLNEALERYRDNPEVFSVTGFNYPRRLLKMPADYEFTTYFSYRAHTWSWATWKDRWEDVDFKVRDFNDLMRNKKKQRLFNRGGGDLTGMLKAQMEGRIDSWGIRFCYDQFLKGAYCLYPVVSLIENIGFDSSGVHCPSDNCYKEDITRARQEFIYPDKFEVVPEIEREFKKIFKVGLVEKISGLFTWMLSCIKVFLPS